MKKCPYCAEEIQDDAIKCRYCGESLNVPKKEMTICSHCKESVKKNAMKCPHCGESLFYQKYPLALIGLVIGGIIGWFFSSDSQFIKNDVFDLNAVIVKVLYMGGAGLIGGVIGTIIDTHALKHRVNGRDVYAVSYESSHKKLIFLGVCLILIGLVLVSNFSPISGIYNSGCIICFIGIIVAIVGVHGISRKKK